MTRLLIRLEQAVTATVLSVALVLWLAGCGTLSGLGSIAGSAKADVAALEVALSAAETAALAYVSLPPCAPAAPPLCSKAEIVARIGQLDETAYAAVKTAEGIAGSLTADRSLIVNAIAGARAAISGLQAVLATLPKRGG